MISHFKGKPLSTGKTYSSVLSSLLSFVDPDVPVILALLLLVEAAGGAPAVLALWFVNAAGGAPAILALFSFVELFSFVDSDVVPVALLVALFVMALPVEKGCDDAEVVEETVVELAVPTTVVGIWTLTLLAAKRFIMLSWVF